MASIKPYAGGGWRASVKVGGVRKTRTFGRKSDAQTWAAHTELELKTAAGKSPGQAHTLRQALRRYADEVSPQHKGHRWECIRLKSFEDKPDGLPIDKPLASVTTSDLTAWRRARQEQVSAGTVLREISLLSGVFSTARREWHWIDASPMTDLRRPAQPAHRDRTITGPEIRRTLRALGYVPGPGTRAGTRPAPRSFSQIVAHAFLLALTTGMRKGELLGLRWADVHDKWVVLHDTKNGTARDVPLSPVARRLLAALRPLDRPLPIEDATCDALFRKARDRAGLSGFRFHDARHTAATRIGRTVGQAGRLSFPEFCKVFGWRDPKYALVYVNPSASDLSGKL